MSAPLRVGIIGMGALGRRHAENIASLYPQAELLAIADPQPAARAAASSFEAATYDTGLGLLDQARVQAVIIASSPETHVELVKAAADRGVDILCEKPLGMTAREASEAVEAAARAKVGLQVGFMRRYDPAYRKAYDAIQNGDIGIPVLLTAISRDRTPPDRTYFTSYGAGNPLIESAGHDFDLARWLLGSEAIKAWATGATLSCCELSDVQPFDTALATLWLQSGAMASIQVYKNAGYGYDIRTEIVGTEGTIFVGPSPSGSGSILTRKLSRDLPQHWLERFADAYRSEVEDFVDRVLDGRPPPVAGGDGLRAVEISEAADRSRLTGEIVTL